MSTNPLLATVRGIYEAFQRGDIASILDTLADDVAWESWTDNSAQAAGVPWLKAGTGKGAAAAFFQGAASMTIHHVEVRDFLTSESQIAVEFVIEATAPSGYRYRDEELHLWSFNATGKVVRMRHYTDTAKHIRAAAAPGRS